MSTWPRDDTESDFRHPPPFPPKSAPASPQRTFLVEIVRNDSVQSYSFPDTKDIKVDATYITLTLLDGTFTFPRALCATIHITP